MARPETLPSSLRKKKRYLAFEVKGQEKVEFNQLVGAIWHTVLNLYGEMKTSSIDLWLVKDLWQEGAQRGVVKCSHHHVDEVRLALALLDRIGDDEVMIRTLGVTGTMKSARKKFLNEKGLEDFES
ncbi:MAG: Rpp14/Pop5 family protein [Candidatus Aenigmatarchaeota archaeon]